MTAPAAFWRDYQFWIAAAAATPVWLALHAVSAPTWNPTWPLTQPLVFMQLALLYPLLEEIVFRGGVQTLGHRWLPALSLGAVSLSNIATSLLFTALHLLYHPPLWALAVFGPSLVFGYFKDRYGTLPTPIVLHAAYNAGYYWLLPPAATAA